MPSWPREWHLELCPRYWARTRARLDPVELARPFGHVTVPPSLAAEEQGPTGGRRLRHVDDDREASTGRLGAVEIEHAGGSFVTAHTKIGAAGVSLIKTDSHDAAVARKLVGFAYDRARKHVYLARNATLDTGVDVTAPFLARASYDGGQASAAGPSRSSCRRRRRAT
jgi:hypothetical protein